MSYELLRVIADMYGVWGCEGPNIFVTTRAKDNGKGWEINWRDNPDWATLHYDGKKRAWLEIPPDLTRGLQGQIHGLAAGKVEVVKTEGADN